MGSASGADPALIWLRFEPGVRGDRLVEVADTLRRAVLEHFTELVGGPEHVPPVVHGHATARGDEHVRWLPLPDCGHDRADGRIQGACIFLPPGTPPQVVEMLAIASARIRRLVRPRRFGAEVSPVIGSSGVSELRRWTGPSVRWASATPVIHDRYVRGGPDLAEVASWCAHAGLPAPVSVRLSEEPLIAGALVLAPRQLGRFAGRRLPYGHLELCFSEQVAGPVVVGRGRHFGLGLCVADPPDGSTADRGFA